MAKCKYPNEICKNMTVFKGEAYCDSVPCSLKDEIPKETNADIIRSMTNEELVDFIESIKGCCGDDECEYCYLSDCNYKYSCTRFGVERWLVSEVEE